MADSNNQEMITQFCDVTGTTPDRATFFLESANWQLQVNMQIHYCARGKIIRNIFGF